MVVKRYAFVLPRFGESNIGGAENLSGLLARKLYERGDHVEIFTTCATDNRTWENRLPPGPCTEFGLQVHRFLVDERNLERWIPLQIRLHEGQRLNLDEQLNWMADSVNSSDLYSSIAERAEEFDAWFFAPYLFGTTFHGSLIAPRRSVLIPCLHDESYAYTDVVASMFRQVAGCLFNASAEQRLAERIYGPLRGGVVGMGFDPVVIQKPQPYFNESFPYLLYLGRKETGKNVHLLVRFFLKAREEGRLAGIKLVIAGGGSFDDLHIPNAKQHPDVIDLVHLTEDEKFSVLHYAIALCQPSTNESFSIVLMEAWLAGTPGLVNAFCDVTKDHVEVSGGGCYFADFEDFVGCCEMLENNPELRSQMAASGRAYVLDFYGWEKTLNRFDAAMQMIFEKDHEIQTGDSR